MDFPIEQFFRDIFTDLLVGLIATAILAALMFLVRKVGPRRWKSWADKLHRRGWPFLTLMLFVVILIFAILRRVRPPVIVLLAVLLGLTSVLVFLYLFGPAKIRRLLGRAQAYPWQILSGVLVLSILVLLAMPARFISRERMVFVVDLDHHEMMVLRDILDGLERQLGADIFLMNVDSSRHIACLHKMMAPDTTMKWDLIAVDNNILGILAKRKLVQELSEYRKYDKLVPSTVLLPIRPLLKFEGRFYFAPFRPNVKIAFYNQRKFDQYHLEPPKDWAQLLNVARVFKEKERVGRVAIQGYPGKACAATVFEFVKAAGGDPLTLDDEESKDAFDHMQRLEEYLVTEHAEVTFDTANQMLIEDRVYLVSNWTFGIKVVIEEAGRKDHINVYSGWRGPKAEVHVLGGDVLAIPAGAARPKLAIKLVELLLSRQTQRTLAGRLCWPPVRWDAYHPELSPYLSVIREALARAEARPTDPEWIMKEAVLNQAYEGLIQKGGEGTSLEEYRRRLKEIPSDYTCYDVQWGDTLEKIAHGCNTTVDVLAKLNGITSQTPIHPDHFLLVPR